jgi:hypothetical protein
MIKPQTTFKDAKVIKKIGKWTIETYTNPNTGTRTIAVTDGFNVDYPIYYDWLGSVAYDYEKVPKSVRKWIANNPRIFNTK